MILDSATGPPRARPNEAPDDFVRASGCLLSAVRRWRGGLCRLLRCFLCRRGCRRAATCRPDIVPVLFEHLGADALHLEQVFRAAERPVLLPVLDDRLRLGRPDAVEFLSPAWPASALFRLTGPAIVAPKRQQAEDQGTGPALRDVLVVSWSCASLVACAADRECCALAIQGSHRATAPARG
jgi:hypothetical protein